jgi:hypothetical protein
MPVTVTRTHAAPYIRYQLIQYVGMAGASRTKRDRLMYLHMARGLGQALGIMSQSQDQQPIDGIADRESLPIGYERAAREWLGHEADRLLGPDEG